MEFPSDEMRRAALGEMPCDLLIKDGVLVLPNTHEVVEGDIAIHGGHIVGLFEEYEAKKTLDADGMYICPGLIDGHIHVESTMLTLTRFSTLALSHGVTTIVCDPHEIANVCGISGVAALIKESYNVPMSVLFTAPSCVPASPFEMGGAVLDSRDVMQLLSSDKVVALGEMMNFPGLLQGEAVPVSKVRVAKEMGMRVDGHSPLLSGKELDAYILMGAQSDHECSLGEEALEKLRKGMWVMIREGTSAHNLDLLGYLLHKGVNLRRCMLVTDDRDVRDIAYKGYLDEVIRRAIQMGVPPIDAITLATLNPATYFSLREYGNIKIGSRADLVMVEDLEDFKVHTVLTGGQVVVENGKPTYTPQKTSFDEHILKTVHCPPVSRDMLTIHYPEPQLNTRPNNPTTQDYKKVRVRVIGLVEGSIITESLIEEVDVVDGELVPAPERDISRLAVIKRHRDGIVSQQNIPKLSLGFLHGLGIQRGAIASTIAHDAHNLVVAGIEKESMSHAIEQIRRMQGGVCIADEGGSLAWLKLEVAGLMSTEPTEKIMKNLDKVERAAHSIGCTHPSPIMALSFVALSPVPHLKLTDRGLIEDMHPVKLVLD